MVPGFDSLQRIQCPALFLQDGCRRLGPHERFWRGVVVVQVVKDRRFELGNAAKRAAPDALASDLGEEALDEFEP